MDWTAPVDGYCERLGPGFWAEPANAVSNAAFLLVALVAYLRWRELRADRLTLGFILLVGVIGIGSFLFHTIAERWASLADVLPIAVFIYAYFALALGRFLRLGRLHCLVGTALFFVASLAAGPLLGPLAGSSAGYVPGLLAMLGIGGWLALRRRAPGRTVLAAGGVFCVSITFRMADLPLCDAWPLGTHVLWHILNALTLGLLLAAALTRAPRRTAAVQA
ncbi:ceramidase domain-containing protein [Mangrovibrevibacter kandeliae]|uniref:ceramidase domain-containing protein n=1 Tax=Mangrovibrevibacter kandeliae TaxID=2968473 RepID=UPI002118E308|nr:ceramidase domain-containing protein [Aurantimonas sp. CSK15Z-1]MCQ8782264.1 ceramidase [Aurantimonas sp. CSK15Z-1]